MAPSAASSAVLSLLQSRKLDRTLTSVARLTPPSAASLGSVALDQGLRGGVPRGQLSEVVGPVSSGRTSLAWAALAAATARGEWAALIDTFDRFDPERAAEAGVVLSRLLWVRGQALSKTSGAIDPDWIPGERSVQGPGTLLERTLDRAIKALHLVAQSGVCTMVVLDLIDAPAQALARVPRSIWLRLHRVVEGSEIALLLLAASPVARSAGGLSITTGATAAGAAGEAASASVEPARGTHVRWKGAHERTRRLRGCATGVRTTSPRGFVSELPLAIG
jgi:recombination protein RecA